MLIHAAMQVALKGWNAILGGNEGNNTVDEFVASSYSLSLTLRLEQ